MKADTYSFGVLVLEIISSRKNTDLSLPNEMQYLPEHVRCSLSESNSIEATRQAWICCPEEPFTSLHISGMEALRAIQDPGTCRSEGAGRGVRREGGAAGVPDRAAVRAAVPEPAASDVGGRADADDEERPDHPRADEASVP